MNQYPSKSQSDQYQMSNNSKFRYSSPSSNNATTKYYNNNKQYAFNTNKINKMPDEQLVGTLKYHGLNSKGSPEILRKRLKEFMKIQMSQDINETSIPTDQLMYAYFLIIDFEATCDEINGANFKHEIIEFPIILYDVVLKRKVDVFHSYCKPFINPSLSQFCMTLTNINQCTIDNAKSFPEVLTEVEQWLNKHHMFAKSFAVVCDCNADMAKFMRIQCEISNLEFPTWGKQWINIMKTFRQFYTVAADVKLNMQKMLSGLGLEFKGRQHSGLNDAENILRITETMISDGCLLRINEKLDSSPPHFTATVTRSEAVINSYGPNEQRIDFSNKTAISAKPFSTLKIVDGADIDFSDLTITSYDNAPIHLIGNAEANLMS